MPRCMPSVGFIATARTRFSPRCCCTSTTTSMASVVARLVGHHAHRVVDCRQPGLELDVHDRTDHLNDFADVLRVHSSVVHTSSANESRRRSNTK